MDDRCDIAPEVGGVRIGPASRQSLDVDPGRP
jgi:hypothetical protein